MSTGRYFSLAAATALALCIGGSALAAKAPEDPVEKRFQTIEKQQRQLRAIILQSRDTGQPVSVRVTSDPDPVLEGLQTRLDDLEQAARTRNEQIDSLQRDLDVARKDAADAKAAVQATEERLVRIEGRLKTLDDGLAAVSAAQAAAPPPAAAPTGPAPPPGRTTPPVAAGPAPATADSQEAFRQAKQLLLEGQYAPASGAFQSYVDTYGDTPNGPEARYWLGETLYIRGMYPEAATAYIGAIRGWPQTPWAPDALIKLSRSLKEMDKAKDACRILDELGRRYPNAPASSKTKAAEVRKAAACA